MSAVSTGGIREPGSPGATGARGERERATRSSKSVRSLGTNVSKPQTTRKWNAATGWRATNSRAKRNHRPGRGS